jgi:hypothetical protein
VSKKTWERLARVERLLAETETVIRVVEAPWLTELASRPPEPKPAPAPAPARELHEDDTQNNRFCTPRPETRAPIKGSRGRF